MSAPYLAPAEGSWFSAEDWNEVQIRALEELATHRHATGSLSGQSVDPAARITVATAATGALRVGVRNLEQQIEDRVERSPLGQRLQDVVPLSGGRVNGNLEVQGDLRVRGDLRVGGQIYLNGRSLTGPAEVAGPAVKLIELWLDHSQWTPLNNGSGGHCTNLSFELPWAARTLVIAKAMTAQRLDPDVSSNNFSVTIGYGKNEGTNWIYNSGAVVGSINANQGATSADAEGRGLFSLPAGPAWLFFLCQPHLVYVRVLILAFRETP